MKPEMISKTDIALIQLETAIALCLIGLYIPAITLAGAAEEILSKSLEHQGKDSMYKEQCEQVIENLNLNLSIYEVGKQYINYVKNELKHFDHQDRYFLFANLEREAATRISTALMNFTKLTGKMTEDTMKFHEWFKENKSTICVNSDR